MIESLLDFIQVLSACLMRCHQHFFISLSYFLFIFPWLWFITQVAFDEFQTGLMTIQIFSTNYEWMPCNLHSSPSSVLVEIPLKLLDSFERLSFPLFTILAYDSGCIWWVSNYFNDDPNFLKWFISFRLYLSRSRLLDEMASKFLDSFEWLSFPFSMTLAYNSGWIWWVTNWFNDFPNSLNWLWMNCF